MGAILALNPETAVLEGGGDTLSFSYSAYNELGQPETVEEPGAAAGAFTTKTFEYNSLGWLLKSCVHFDQGNGRGFVEPCTEYAYDELGGVTVTKTQLVTAPSTPAKP